MQEDDQKIGLPRAKYLVFTSAGDHSNLDHWLQGDRNFDLWITYYGDQGARYKDAADFYNIRKGYKFPNLYYVYQHWKDIIDHYEAIFVMDDDIIIDASGISRMFDVRKQYDLWLCQPAFDPKGKISHKITEVRALMLLRYTNFVEMTCPLFRRDKLDAFMEIYDQALLDYGMDWYFLDFFGPDLNGKVALIDAISCINPFDSTKGGIREIDKNESLETRVKVWKDFEKKHNIQSEKKGYLEFGSIKNISNAPINIPQFPVRLPGSFWGISTFFNPAGYKNRKENYSLFRKNSKKQGLNLCVVELAFGDAPFELSDSDADILIQLRGDDRNVMWQKEALLNIGLKRLPDDCDKVAWIDGDILFKNDNWIKETSGLLEKYVVVQPFSLAVQLSQGIYDKGKEEIDLMPFGWDTGEKFFSCLHNFVISGNWNGRSGLAWAIRKEVILKHFFYDKFLLGSSDYAMAWAFTFKDAQDEWLQNNIAVNAEMSSHYALWTQSVYKDVQSSVWYTSGTVLHLWHGDLSGRLHYFRAKILKFFNYSPQEDAVISSQGLLEWASDKSEFHQAVKEYFQLRNEEGKSIFISMLTDELLELKKTEQEFHRIKDTPEIKSYRRSYEIVHVLLNAYDSLPAVLKKMASYVFNGLITLIQRMKGKLKE